MALVVRLFMDGLRFIGLIMSLPRVFIFMADGTCTLAGLGRMYISRIPQPVSSRDFP